MRIWQCGTHSVQLDRPRVMGIVNVTADSFSDGGRFLDAAAAIEQARRLVDEGADILDIGAESTRPGADPVPAARELERLLPVLEGIVGLGVPISVDTYKPEVMRATIAAGASIINDIRGFADDGSQRTVAGHDCGVCIMHMQGEPGTMQDAPVYADVVEEVSAWLEAQAASLEQHGVARDRIVVDPGFGFGKTQQHNLDLLRDLDRVTATGRPVLVGMSRKRMMAHWSGRPQSQPSERVAASVAAALFAVSKGARIVRVHDVRETVDALRLWTAASDRSGDR